MSSRATLYHSNFTLSGLFSKITQLWYLISSTCRHINMQLMRIGVASSPNLIFLLNNRVIKLTFPQVTQESDSDRSVPISGRSADRFHLHRPLGSVNGQLLPFSEKSMYIFRRTDNNFRIHGCSGAIVNVHGCIIRNLFSDKVQ